MNNDTCENCGCSQLETFIEKRNHRLMRCPDCNLYQKGFLESASIYEEQYHVGYSKRVKSKTVTAEIRLASITPYLNTDRPRMLDIGCSVGATVQAAKNFGWEAHGVDISQHAVKHCQAKGLDCHKIDGLKLPFEDNHFDLVTNWHVIEHVEDVTETLNEWRRVLKPGGVMILETPSGRYLKAKIMGPRYKKFWPKAHLYIFDKNNMSSLLEKTGFEMLPTRLLGKTSRLPIQRNAYALAYRGFRELTRSLRICKSFEVCCRKAA